MIKIYYWSTKQWCYENKLNEFIKIHGSGYYITHVRPEETNKQIDELIHEITKR